MRIRDRHDGLLLAGLALAGFVVFERPIQYLLEIAGEVELRHGISLLPPLVILTALFVFHQNLKRQEGDARAAAAAAEAERARTRAADLERLVAFGNGLARALSLDALREVVWRHLPRIAGERDTWLFVRDAGDWQEVVGASLVKRDAVSSALSAPGALESDAPTALAGSTCFPLRVGDQLVGALGVDESRAPDPSTRQMLAALAPLLGIAIRNIQLFAETQDTATRDRLTGCYNRLQGLTLLDGELRRAGRTRAPLAVVMFDVDHFKQINDQHGHLTGDATLAAIGTRLADSLRRSDHRCRYGGDEFLIILPDTPPHAALLVAEAIRRQVLELSVPGPVNVPLSISVGVAHAIQGDLDVTALIGRADAALYRAKRAGRNCVRVDEVTCDSAETAVLELMPTAGALPS